MPVKSLKTDASKSQDGVWLSVDDDFQPCSSDDNGTEKIKVAKWNNGNVEKTRMQLQKTVPQNIG